MYSVCLFLFLAGPSRTTALIQEVAASGRVIEIAASYSDRIAPPPQIAPGAPPLISFRLFEGQTRNRYGGLDLVLDDAGH